MTGTDTVVPVVAAVFPHSLRAVKILVCASDEVSLTQMRTLPASLTQVEVTIKLLPVAVVIFVAELIPSVPSAHAAVGSVAIAAPIRASLVSLFILNSLC